MTTSSRRLNRPEYPKNPEAFQSALAWSLADSTVEIDPENFPEKVDPSKPTGLIYRKISSRARNINLLETCPGSSEIGHLSNSLGDAGLQPDASISLDFVSESLLGALEGVKPDRAKGIAAAPVTRAAAFLQNPVGVHTKANPPNFAKIIEQIYAAGNPAGSESSSAADAWYKAITAYEGRFEKAIESGLSGYLENSALGLRLPNGTPSSPPGFEQPLWLRQIETPFSWFHRNWSTFCSPQWRKALAGRRWSDWASCILRTGISAAYLWESRFYRDLGKLLLSESISEGEARSKLIDHAGPLLEWYEPNLRLTVRDQNSVIRTIINDGYTVRSLLQDNPDVLERVDSEELELDDWQTIDGFDRVIRAIHRNLTGADRDSIAACFERASSGAKNTVETVQYSLGIRQETGKHADFYGLIARRSRRFLVVEPGEEWIVVIASMCAAQPSGRTVLRTVRQSLAQLGISVSRDVLVGELERAGLTTSSHDADDAIEVWAGF